MVVLGPVPSLSASWPLPSPNVYSPHTSFKEYQLFSYGQEGFNNIYLLLSGLQILSPVEPPCLPLLGHNLFASSILISNTKMGNKGSSYVVTFH
jgi:hypothetical protein